MKTRLLVPLATLLLSGCLTTTPSASPKAAKGEAKEPLLPSSNAAVISTEQLPPKPVENSPASPVDIPASAAPAALAPETPAPAVEAAQPPESPGAGRIVRVNTKLHYVLLDVSGRLHAGQDVVVFRDGQAVGRLRMSAPRQGRYASADILDGDVREGDLVK